MNGGGGGDSRNAKIQHRSREEVDTEVVAKEEEGDDEDEERQKKRKKKRTHTQEGNATDFCAVLAGLCFLENTEKIYRNLSRAVRSLLYLPLYITIQLL